MSGGHFIIQHFTDFAQFKLGKHLSQASEVHMNMLCPLDLAQGLIHVESRSA